MSRSEGKVNESGEGGEETASKHGVDFERRVKAAFDAVADLPSAEHAAAIARLVASDPEPDALRQRVERLLALSAAATDPAARIVDRASGEIAGSASALAVVGRYRLLRKIAAGGMGEVFEAEQSEPIQRRVALKLIKPGLGSAEVLRRFESERQVLSLMTHNAIAQVFDAGTADDGRPFFVMELVDGSAIDAHCDQRRLGIEERLRLFLSVCDGVQHAHRKGIIHRDLKPSNVLVAEQSGASTSKPSSEAGVPKIIDFGIAKALDPVAVGGAPDTVLGSTLGTPEYMSPEQAGLARDVDIRTDVYSLGVLLYELMVGSRPFPSEQLRDLGMDEARRIVREQPPDRLSVRAARIDASDPALARRRVSKTDLRRRLAGDLEWICVKALAKDPEDRYGSVTELSDDIRRHLAQEPIAAGPPSWRYRASKFVQRNRFAVVAASTIVAALLVGIVGLGIGLQRARAAQRVAQAEVERTQTAANFLAGIVHEFDAHEMGEAILTRVEQAAQEAGTNTVEQTLASMNRPDLARSIVGDQVLRRASERLEQDFAEDPQVRTRLLINLARAYERLSLLEPAIDHAERAVELGRQELGDRDPDTVDSISYYGDLMIMGGRLDEAEQAYEEVFEARRSLPLEDAGRVNAVKDLGMIAAFRQDFVRTYRLLTEAYDGTVANYGVNSTPAFDILATLAIASNALHRYDEAEAQARLLVANGELHGNQLTAQLLLARMLQVQGKFDEGETLFAAMLAEVPRAWGEGDNRTSMLRARRGNFLASTGRPRQAIELLEPTVAAIAEQMGAQNPVTLGQQAVLSAAYAAVGDFTRARANIEPAVALFGAFPDPKPQATWSFFQVLGDLQWRSGQFDEAVATAESLIAWVDSGAQTSLAEGEEVDELVEQTRRDNRLPFERMLGRALLSRAEPGDLERGTSLLQSALDRYAELFDPSHYETAATRALLGDALLRADPPDLEGATVAIERAVADLESIFGQGSHAIADAYQRAAALSAARGDTAGAAALVQLAVAAEGATTVAAEHPALRSLAAVQALLRVPPS